LQINKKELLMFAS